jgi:hypothetical protein
VDSVDIELTHEQRDRIELIALLAGKSTTQALVDAAQFLLDRDAADSSTPRLAEPQQFLSQSEMDARFSRILHHR